MAGQTGVMVGVQAGNIVATDLDKVLSESPALNADLLKLTTPLAM